MNVILTNIQSIKSGVFSFPDKGLVQIKGDNSNGKSILIKALSAVVTLKILDEDERQALINDKEMTAYILIEHNGAKLLVQLSRERINCAMMLERASGEKTTRTFRDGGLSELIYEFGFRCYGKNSVCLQLYETFGLMPFVNTTKTMNGEIVESITEDKIAKEFLKNFKEITYPTARQRIKDFDEKIAQAERIKNMITLFDYQAYEEICGRLWQLYEVLKNFTAIELQKLSLLPKLEILPVKVMTLEKIDMPPKAGRPELKPFRLNRLELLHEINGFDEPDNLSQLIADMSDLRSGRCPTCHRLFVENK